MCVSFTVDESCFYDQTSIHNFDLAVNQAAFKTCQLGSILSMQRVQPIIQTDRLEALPINPRQDHSIWSLVPTGMPPEYI